MAKSPYDPDPSVSGLFRFLGLRDEDKREPVHDEFKGWPAAGPPEGR